ncbi:hypothetical protein NDU88_002792 [Pleurodeles waltl]|uniref:Uncharacterized protein n=1 Tax=Pleurodeles waltl TaxID=8319 RepID=A0AAV7TLN0_PLEWA|nr:hypothetical protein NDU88_002792 [Pleurodeles waltl]
MFVCCLRSACCYIFSPILDARLRAGYLWPGSGLVHERRCGPGPKREAGWFLGGPVLCRSVIQCGWRGGRSLFVGPHGGPSSRYQQWGPEEMPGSLFLSGVRSLAAAPDQGQNATANPTPVPGAPEVRPRWGTRASTRPAASPGEMIAPGKVSGAPVPGRGVALVSARPFKIQAAPTDRGQAGCRGAPEAAPQPAGPPPGRAAVRAHQPRSPPAIPQGSRAGSPRRCAHASPTSSRPILRLVRGTRRASLPRVH